MSKEGGVTLNIFPSFYEKGFHLNKFLFDVSHSTIKQEELTTKHITDRNSVGTIQTFICQNVKPKLNT